MKNWKTVKSKTAYECKYFKILEEDFLTPSGKAHKWHTLKRSDYIIVIAREKDYIYLIEQYKWTIKSKLLEAVAGVIEKKEAPLKAAKRELKEEAGIIAKKFKKLGWFYSYKGVSNQKAFVFLAEDLKFGEQAPDNFEKEAGIKLVKLKISEVKNLIKFGKIKDCDTLSAFSLFMLKCENHFNI